ncbi:hypothetical protein Naga_100119g9 [Nannochloropsis gaditana]|uniref:Uncharacterized protein n=1 Tax=Nannochloropsis gaditana TaxID=72520 RepID=W7U8F5_9STRA|nr:hypothetical protein Naga_100119g9 [Nannochloropsis gaditana]
MACFQRRRAKKGQKRAFLGPLTPSPYPKINRPRYRGGGGVEPFLFRNLRHAQRHARRAPCLGGGHPQAPGRPGGQRQGAGGAHSEWGGGRIDARRGSWYRAGRLSQVLRELRGARNSFVLQLSAPAARGRHPCSKGARCKRGRTPGPSRIRAHVFQQQQARGGPGHSLEDFRAAADGASGSDGGAATEKAAQFSGQRDQGRARAVHADDRDDAGHSCGGGKAAADGRPYPDGFHAGGQVLVPPQGVQQAPSPNPAAPPLARLQVQGLRAQDFPPHPPALRGGLGLLHALCLRELQLPRVHVQFQVGAVLLLLARWPVHDQNPNIGGE